MIKESEEWSESLTHFFLPNTKSYLAITPIITETSKNTRHLKPHLRRCLFSVRLRKEIFYRHFLSYSRSLSLFLSVS